MANDIDLYIDFDGVINIIGGIQPDDLKKALVGGVNIAWRESVIDWLNNLPENVNYIWLTTWEESNMAEEILTPLFPINRPVKTIKRTDYRSLTSDYTSGWWKYDSLKEFREALGLEGRPFIWIDDDILFYADEEFFSMEPSTPKLLLCPNPTFGINDTIIQSVDKFIEDHS